MNQFETKIYPEFTDDPQTWRNHPRPATDKGLEKELESIALTPDGRRRYFLEWGCDAYVDVPDMPEYNDLGMEVGTLKGGRFHENALVVYDVVLGFNYISPITGEMTYKPFSQKDLIPRGVVLSEVTEARSIGVPRFFIKEWLDRSIHPDFGDGDYYAVYTLEELTPLSITDEEIKIESKPLPFERHWVERCRDLYNQRLNTSPEEIEKGLAAQRLVNQLRKQAAENESKERMKEAGAKFIEDKEYLEKSDPVSVVVPADYVENKNKEGKIIL